MCFLNKFKPLKKNLQTSTKMKIKNLQINLNLKYFFTNFTKLTKNLI